jgi:8-oxo-dGTP pyrophosphatase MutT (NUDIX family)
MADETARPRDASTVVLLRDAARGVEVFMVRRHRASGFMGDAFVFPGGKLDDADSSERVLARTRGRTIEEAKIVLGEPDLDARALGLFVAAIRETFEEAGVWIGTGATLDEARGALLAKAAFADVIERYDLALAADRVVPWARWVTPVVEPRRYDTRFFLATCPAEQEATHDEHETTEARWLAPREALELSASGAINLPPPTLRSLELLAEFESTASILTDATTRTPPLVEPLLVQEEGTIALVLPGHPDHPIREQRIPGPTKFVLDQGRWWSRESERAR